MTQCVKNTSHEHERWFGHYKPETFVCFVVSVRQQWASGLLNHALSMYVHDEAQKRQPNINTSYRRLLVNNFFCELAGE